MKHWAAAVVVVLVATATHVAAQAPEGNTLPPPQPQPAAPARPAIVGLPALAHEVGPSLGSAPEYAGLGTGPPAPPPIDDDELHRLSLRGEYLFWWVRHAPVGVPLAVNDLPSAGEPRTFGSDVGHFDGTSGGRLALGYWFNPERTWGVDASGFVLPSQARVGGIQSDPSGNPPIDRPSAVAGQPLLVPVSLPNALAGGLTSRATLRLSGVQINLVWEALSGASGHLDLLAGYRHLDLRESLNVVQAGQALAPLDTDLFGPLEPGDTLLVQDQVATSNRFNGAQVGARAEWACASCYLRLTGEVGLGADSQQLRAAGFTRVLTGLATDTSASFVAPGGVYVGPAGMGRVTRDRSSVVGELGAEAGVHLTSCLRLFVNYSLLVWGDVAHPGDQLGALGGAPPSFHTATFWAQGVGAGLEWRY